MDDLITLRGAHGHTPTEVTVARHADYLLVRLCGPVDASHVEHLTQVQECAAQDSVPVVVDASQLTFCDSTVVGFLTALADDCPVTVDRPSRLVRQTLAAFRLTDRIRVRRPR
jgi:ABC-type transporter Mla MlaB component